MSKVNIKAIKWHFRISKTLYWLEKKLDKDFAEFKVHLIHRKQVSLHYTVLILCNEGARMMAVVCLHNVSIKVMGKKRKIPPNTLKIGKWLSLLVREGCSVADPEGFQGVSLNPLPVPVFKYPMKMK